MVGFTVWISTSIWKTFLVKSRSAVIGIFLKLVTEIGDRHLLARRTPIVDNETGEVLGQLYIAIVLDNNFSLAESIQQGSNCENIVIEAHGSASDFYIQWG